MFLLKKIVTLFFMPLSVILGLLVMGIVLLMFTRRHTAAKVILVMATFVFLITGFGFIFNGALVRLERTYPPLDLQDARDARVKWIVVLAGGHTTDSTLPLISQLAPETLVRLTEGIVIYRSLPGAKLLLSGGHVFDPNSSALFMAELAGRLGVNRRDIFLEDKSQDTDDEAAIIKPMLGKQKFILVTSAYHMPRSMKLFTAQGMEPIPAPVGHYIHTDERISPGDFSPRLGNFRNAEIVIHEILGIISIEFMELFRD